MGLPGRLLRPRGWRWADVVFAAQFLYSGLRTDKRAGSTRCNTAGFRANFQINPESESSLWHRVGTLGLTNLAESCKRQALTCLLEGFLPSLSAFLPPFLSSFFPERKYLCAQKSPFFLIRHRNSHIQFSDCCINPRFIINTDAILGFYRHRVQEIVPGI